MKRILFLLIVLITFISCNPTTEPTNVTKVTTKQTVKVEKIMEPIDQGLHKITLDDSIVILLYRGTESCTMLELK